MGHKPKTDPDQSSNSLSGANLKALVKHLKSTVKCPKGVSLDSVEMQHQCWRSKLVLNGRGHCQPKFKGIKYLGHRVMAAVSNNMKYVPFTEETKQTASHRCGNPWCINPNHLVYEHEEINHTRDCCRRYKDRVETYMCPHRPCCIGFGKKRSCFGLADYSEESSEESSDEGSDESSDDEEEQSESSTASSSSSSSSVFQH